MFSGRKKRVAEESKRVELQQADERKRTEYEELYQRKLARDRAEAGLARLKSEWSTSASAFLTSYPEAFTGVNFFDFYLSKYESFIQSTSDPRLGQNYLDNLKLYASSIKKIFETRLNGGEVPLTIYFEHDYVSKSESWMVNILVVTSQSFIYQKKSKIVKVASKDAIISSSWNYREDTGYSAWGDAFGRSWRNLQTVTQYLSCYVSVRFQNFSFTEVSGFSSDDRELAPLFTGIALQEMVNTHPIESSFVPSSPLIGKPAPRLIRKPEDAELVAMEWMKFFGFTDAAITNRGADGGIDVTSSLAVAQVKAEMIPTGRPKIQQLHGVAQSLNKKAFFFALNGYSKEAYDFADSIGMALFSFNLQGEPVAENQIARHYISATSVP